MALSAPQNLAVSGTTVSWAAPADVGAGIKFYRVYRNGVLYQEVPGNITSLANVSSPFPVAVQAVDKAGTVSAQATLGTPYWAKALVGTKNVYVTAIAVDSEDNIVAGGHVSPSTVDFGGGPVSSSTFAFYLAKYRKDGTHLWSYLFPVAGGSLKMHGVVVDSADNIYITGEFRGSVNFGGGAITSGVKNTFTAAFLASFEDSGEHRWSKSFLSSVGYGPDSGHDDSFVNVGVRVAVDSTDRVVLSGWFQGMINLGGATLGAAFSGTHVYVAKFQSSDGSHVWSKGFYTSNDARIKGLDLDEDDNILICGVFVGSINFGGGDLLTDNTLPNQDVYIAKLDSSGNHIWSKRWGSYYGEHAYDVAFDSAGNVIFLGGFTYQSNFGVPVSSTGSRDLVLAKYDSNGNYSSTTGWVLRTGTGFSDVQGFQIALDDEDNILICGWFLVDAHFGGASPVTSVGGGTGFLAKYTPNGNYVFASSHGYNGDDQISGVAVDSEGAIVTGGFFTGFARFGTEGNLSGDASYYSGFIWRRAP